MLMNSDSKYCSSSVGLAFISLFYIGIGESLEVLALSTLSLAYPSCIRSKMMLHTEMLTTIPPGRSHFRKRFAALGEKGHRE